MIKRARDHTASWSANANANQNVPMQFAGSANIKKLERNGPDQAMRAPISVGVVGCGYWGPLLVRNFKGLANCRLKTVCDVREARLKHIRALYPDVEGVTGYDQLLNGAGLDAVVIATPVKHHYSLAKASLEAGKHTLIEKPMAASSAECEELNDIAKRKGLVLMVGHTFLYSSAIRKIVEIIRAAIWAVSAILIPTLNWLFRRT